MSLQSFSLPLMRKTGTLPPHDHRLLAPLGAGPVPGHDAVRHPPIRRPVAHHWRLQEAAQPAAGGHSRQPHTPRLPGCDTTHQVQRSGLVACCGTPEPMALMPQNESHEICTTDPNEIKNSPHCGVTVAAAARREHGGIGAGQH